MNWVAIGVEFHQRTIAGWTRCLAGCSLTSLKSEEALNNGWEYIRKILNSEAISDLVITFTCKASYGKREVSRFWREVNGKYTIVRWDEKGNVIENLENQKVGARQVKALIAECMDILSEEA